MLQHIYLDVRVELRPVEVAWKRRLYLKDFGYGSRLKDGVLSEGNKILLLTHS